MFSSNPLTCHYGFDAEGCSACADEFVGFPNEVFGFAVAFLVDDVGGDFEVENEVAWDGFEYSRGYSHLGVVFHNFDLGFNVVTV